MTKVQLEYKLVRPLTDADAKAISDVHGSYGFYHVKLAPTLDKIMVDFDASRLTEKDVEAVLLRYGVPIERKWVVP
jgi:hypothetical protein